MGHCCSSAANSKVQPFLMPSPFTFRPPAVLSVPPFLQARIKFLWVLSNSPYSCFQDTGQVFPRALALASPHPQHLPELGQQTGLKPQVAYL